MTLWLGRYSRLLILNAKLFLQSFKLDAGMIFVGLVYVFGGRSELNLTVSNKGLFLLVGFLFAALMEAQLIKANAANLVFYLKLPINREGGLALFYLAFALPILVAFTVIFLLLRWLLGHHLGFSLEFPIFSQRYLQALFALLFIKSLAINCMIAMSIHFGLIAVYFIGLVGIIFGLSILQELLMPLLPMSNFSLGFLFLLATYLISFVAVRMIRL